MLQDRELSLKMIHQSKSSSNQTAVMDCVDQIKIIRENYLQIDDLRQIIWKLKNAVLLPVEVSESERCCENWRGSYKKDSKS